MKATRAPKPALPIPLTDAELKVMGPYLQAAASAARAYRSATDALDAIAKTISGRSGAPPDRRFKLDLPGKRLIPLG